MPLTRIKNKGLGDSVSFENINDTGTEGTKVASGTTAQRGSTQGQIRFNTTTGLAEYYDGTQFKSIDAPPTITSISPTDLESSNLPANITITGSNFSSSVTVVFIGSDGTETNSPSVTRNSNTQITAQVPSTITSANEPFDIKVTNSSSNLGGTLGDALNIDASPVFGVASGSLGTLTNADRAGSNLTTITATDDEGDTVTFSVTSGSLPTGITLNSNGTFSGTANAETSTTTYSFTVTASDGTNTSDRAYTITVNSPQTYAFSYTGATQTWAKPTGLTSVTAYVWGAGGGGGGNSEGVSGGSGGYAEAVIDVSSLSNLYLVVGQGGFGGGSSSMQAGSGGGLSGIFDASTINLGDSILIAGSGGGGSGAVGSGAGAGGYGGGANASGSDGARDTRLNQKTEGSGGTSSGGGAAGNSSDALNSYVGVNPTAGSGLTGGNGSRQVSGGSLNSAAFAQGGRSWTDAGDGAWMGGAGGSGHYGGGGGTNGYAGGGGGGSGYAKSSVTSSVAGTNGTNGSGASSASAPETSSTYYASGIAVGGARNTNGGNGRIVLVY